MLSLLFLLLNLGLFLSIKLLRQKDLIRQFSARKILHFASSMGAVWAVTMLTQREYVSLCLFFLFFYIVLELKQALLFIEERSFQSIGVPLYPLSLVMMGILLWHTQPYHIAGILLLGVPDSIGAWLEERPLQSWLSPWQWKLLSYSFLSLLITLFVLPLWWSLIITMIVTLVERYSKHGLDNVSVPAAYTLSILVLGAIGS